MRPHSTTQHRMSRKCRKWLSNPMQSNSWCCTVPNEDGVATDPYFNFMYVLCCHVRTVIAYSQTQSKQTHSFCQPPVPTHTHIHTHTLHSTILSWTVGRWRWCVAQVQKRKRSRSRTWLHTHYSCRTQWHSREGNRNGEGRFHKTNSVNRFTLLYLFVPICRFDGTWVGHQVLCDPVWGTERKKATQSNQERGGGRRNTEQDMPRLKGV